MEDACLFQAELPQWSDCVRRCNQPLTRVVSGVHMASMRARPLVKLSAFTHHERLTVAPDRPK